MKHYISNSSLDQPLSSDFVIDPLWTSSLPDDADPNFLGQADGDGALAENPADVADIIADPSRFPEIMKARQEQHAAAAEAYRAAVTTLAPPARSAADLMPALALEAAEHAAGARAYPRILAADAARRTKAAKGVAIRAITRIKPGASRAGHARAVHAHVSHGAARASPGDGGDGPPRPPSAPGKRGNARFSGITAEQVEALLDYSSTTGLFFWRERTPNMFEDSRFTAEHACAIWNASSLSDWGLRLIAASDFGGCGGAGRWVGCRKWLKGPEIAVFWGPVCRAGRN